MKERFKYTEEEGGKEEPDYFPERLLSTLDFNAMGAERNFLVLPEEMAERKDTMLDNNSMNEIDEENLADKEDNVGNGNAEEPDEDEDDFDSNRSKLNSESNSLY
jgi:hypothetical protein